MNKATDVIDFVQRKVKPAFFNEGLMVGEFHELNEVPFSINKDFKPIKSPIPSLVIRHMVGSDVDFMIDQKYTPEERISFLSSYLSKDFAEDKQKLAQEQLDLAYRQLEPKKSNK